MAIIRDLTGQKFNRLTAIKFVRCDKGVGNIWRFRCDCGNEVEVLGSRVKNGYTKSCGCLQKEKTAAFHFVDLTGQRFGKLTVIEQVEHHRTSGGYSKVQWKCQCDCGNIVTVLADSLKSGNTKACGCESRSGLEKRTTHGKSKDRLYRIWQGMRNRCNLSTNKYYHNYGGRGISVCAEWNDSFEDFYEWAIKNGYNENLTLDRRDNNGNYEPSNCHWKDRFYQMNHTRKNHLLTYEGRTQTVAEWAREIGMLYGTLHNRLNRYHWSVEEALTIPVKQRK